jgi:hypothetical protein
LAAHFIQGLQHLACDPFAEGRRKGADVPYAGVWALLRLGMAAVGAIDAKA